jgi:hypothetical protein
MDTITISADYSDFALTTGGTQLLNCFAPNGTLTATVNGFPNTAFNWTTVGGTINGGATTPSINVAAAGTYTVNATLNNNCYDTETITVNANFNAPTSSLSSLNELNCITPSSVVTVTTNAGTPGFTWSGPGIQTGQGTSSVGVNAAGTYAVTVIDNVNGCESSANIAVTENFATPSITIGVQDTLSCLHPVVPILNVAVNNSNNYNLAWSTANGILVDGINAINPNVSAAADYTLVATDNTSGCTDTQTIAVTESASSQFAIDLVQYPTIVTLTDGDLLNACWTPYLPGLAQSDLYALLNAYDLKIYNRWGELMFETSSPGAYCPGKDELSQGTYFYTLVMSSICGGVENYQISGTFLVK